MQIFTPEIYLHVSRNAIHQILAATKRTFGIYSYSRSYTQTDLDMMNFCDNDMPMSMVSGLQPGAQ